MLGCTKNPCLEELREMRKKYGTSTFNFAVKKLNRERLESGKDRPKRVKFAWSMYKRLYEKQRGICPRCRKTMVLLRGEVEIDHIEPNAGEGFNDQRNLRVLHASCNHSKGANTIYEEAKKLNRTITEMLE